MPTASMEVFVAQPAPGVVGVSAPSVATSMGFGVIQIRGSHLSATFLTCDSHKCGVFDKCGSNICGVHGCGVLSDCGTLKCTGFESCPRLDTCGTYVHNRQAFVAEIEANWGHPLVKELRAYLRANTSDALVSAVSHYIGRNMYDASAAPQTGLMLRTAPSPAPARR